MTSIVAALAALSLSAAPSASAPTDMAFSMSTTVVAVQPGLGDLPQPSSVLGQCMVQNTGIQQENAVRELLISALEENQGRFEVAAGAFGFALLSVLQPCGVADAATMQSAETQVAIEEWAGYTFGLVLGKSFQKMAGGMAGPGMGVSFTPGDVDIRAVEDPATGHISFDVRLGGL